MDRRFLKEIAEGYITNHDVFSEFKPKQVDLIRETVYNDLCEVCDELRCEDEPFYNTLYFSNRFYQNDVFENYLNIRYKSAGNNEIDSDGELEEGFATMAAGAGDVVLGLGSVAVGAGSMLWKFAAYMSALPISAKLVTAGLFYIIYNKFNGVVGKQVFKLLYATGDSLKKFGKFIETSGKNFQLRYAVIQKNFDHCYKRAGFKDDLSKMKLTNYWNKGSGSSEVKYKVIDQKSTNKLVNCYVETTIDIIKLQLRMYLNCIKSTKGYSEMTKLNTAEFMSYIQSSQYKKNEFNLEVTCFEYYKIASDQINQFDDLINYFYTGESEKRQITMKLINSVDDVRNEVARAQKDIRAFSTFKTKTNPKGVGGTSNKPGGFQKKPYNKNR